MQMREVFVMYDGNAASDLYTARMWALDEERQRAVDGRQDEEEKANEKLLNNEDYCIGLGQEELEIAIGIDSEELPKLVLALYHNIINELDEAGYFRNHARTDIPPSLDSVLEHINGIRQKCVKDYFDAQERAA